MSEHVITIITALLTAIASIYGTYKFNRRQEKKQEASEFMSIVDANRILREEIRADLTSAKKEITFLRDELEKAREEIRQLTSELETAKELIKDLQKELEKKDNLIEVLTTKK